MDQHVSNRRFQQLLNALLLTALALLLSSCSHMGRKDGPPNFYVDETKVPNPVPKPEPLAKYGNMRSYVVFGKRYYVMKSSKHYSAVGRASWYGTKFHAQRTSSGERYDMLAMTAAHKTLPLPTYCYVTNLKNNRKIIVKVNDRGPFVGNRLIDLSYVAAKKLGITGHGTATVRLEAIDPYEYAQSKSYDIRNHTEDHILNALPRKRAHSVSVSTIYLQAGAFRSQSNAFQLKHQLASLLHKPVSIKAPTQNSHLYRVQIGPFETYSEAATTKQKLKHLGIHASSITGA